MVNRWDFKLRDPGRGTWEETPVSLWPLQPHLDKSVLEVKLEASQSQQRESCVFLCSIALGMPGVTLRDRFKGHP